MARRSSPRIDENALTKGQKRKLDTLRKSVGDDIGERAFAAWLATQPKGIISMTRRESDNASYGNELAIMRDHRVRPQGGQPPILVRAVWRGDRIEATRFVDPHTFEPIGPACLTHGQVDEIVARIERNEGPS